MSYSNLTPKHQNMKIKLYTFLAAAIGVLLWIANAAGPANVQGIDRTGSPLSPGACDACHSGGNFGPSMVAELLDGANVVTQYQPNKNYTLRVRINTTVNPSRYGFQAVALTGNANVNAGAFGTAPAGFRKSTIQSRQYAEHGSSRPGNTMEFPWTSPAVLGEEIRFYAAGIAANNNGGSNGDASVRLAQPLVITPLTSNTSDEWSEKLNLRLIGNPIADRIQVYISVEDAGNYRFSLFQLNGTAVWSDQRRLMEEAQNLEWDASTLASGIYLLVVEGSEGRTAIKIIK